MIDILSNRIAHIIRFYVDEVTEEKERIISYGINLLIYELITILVIFIPSAIFGYLKQVIAMFIVYGLLRIFAGGAHARTRMICTLTYMSSVFGVIFLANHLNLKSFYPSILVFVLCFITAYKYAPGDTVEKPILSFRIRKRLRVFSLSVIVFLLTLSYIVWCIDKVIFTVMVFSPIPAMILLTPLGYGFLGCQRSSKIM
jgi:accessory gene regulator B